MTTFYSFIDKTLNKLLSLYLILRYLYFVYLKKNLKFLEDFNRQNLSYNKKDNQDALEKNLNFRSQLFNLKKFENHCLTFLEIEYLFY